MIKDMSIKIKLKKNDKIREVLAPNVVVAIVPLEVNFESKSRFFENIWITGGEIVSNFPTVLAKSNRLVDPNESFIIKHIPSFGCVEKIGPNAFCQFQDFQEGNFINDTAIEFMEVVQFNKAVEGFKCGIQLLEIVEGLGK